MRIAHIESSIDWGGQELRIVEQSEWLNRNGHPCWIVARPGSAILAQARQRGLPVCELEIRGAANPATYLRLRHFLLDHDIELLDCHGNRDAAYGAYIKWTTGIRVIRSRHVTNRIRQDRFQRLLWRHGNHGIVVTAGRIRELIAAGRLSPPERVHVAIAGADPQRFSPDLDGSEQRAALGIERAQLVLANVGMIRPDKGQIHYVRASKELFAEFPEIAAIQVGEATTQTVGYKNDVLAEAATPVAGRQVQFVGYQQQVERWLAAADIVVIASIGTEAQTRLVAQAFLMKKLVVATTVGGLPEMIEHGVTGLLCPPKDSRQLAAAIRSLIADPALRERIRENAYRHAIDNLTFEAMMADMQAFYRQTLPTPASR